MPQNTTSQKMLRRKKVSNEARERMSRARSALRRQSLEKCDESRTASGKNMTNLSAKSDDEELRRQRIVSVEENPMCVVPIIVVSTDC